VGGFFEDSYLIPGSRSRVPGTWDPGPGTGSTPRAEHRAPGTELNAHTGSASCSCAVGSRPGCPTWQ